uniref:AAA_28 domain-containing protein n=1 Tax=Rhabditophanes sp. KR3021 TaxID=114890 RepID=A0AC35UD82_9BILA
MLRSLVQFVYICLSTSSCNSSFSSSNSINSGDSLLSGVERDFERPKISLTDLLQTTIEHFVEANSEKALHMADVNEEGPAHRVYKLVLTGGPCGGKTTSAQRLRTFFEDLGWRVYLVPECATILIGGGIKFSDFSKEQVNVFQKDLLQTLLSIEQVYFNQALLEQNKNVLVICDRGAMDPSAYMTKEDWLEVVNSIDLNEFELRDNRYDQIVHLVTAADGAEKFYTLSNNNARSEGIAEALCQEKMTRKAWVGHPYLDIIDNFECSSFEDKILKVIQVICDRVGVKYGDRLAKNTKKRKWLVDAIDESQFTQFLTFDVCHDYLVTQIDGLDVEVRLRKRGNGTKAIYTLTKCEKIHGEKNETKWQLTLRDYNSMLQNKDKDRCTLYKRRRCFNYGNHYFHIDTYIDPLPPACCGRPLHILETYTTIPEFNALPELPRFLDVQKEITGDKMYSMYRFSRLDATKLPYTK